MAALILDTGALIAIERRDRTTTALLRAAALDGTEIRTTSACVAQVWRDPARQVLLARTLAGCVERPLDPVQARRCGTALGASGGADVVDASIAILAGDGDAILTSDPRDIERLLAAIGTRARVRRV
jgi:hypothetical protein